MNSNEAKIKISSPNLSRYLKKSLIWKFQTKKEKKLIQKIKKEIVYNHNYPRTHNVACIINTFSMTIKKTNIYT